jgi:hypothetical protein
VLSFMEKLRLAQAEISARDPDAWRLPLERVRGKIDFDGLERVSSQTLLDLLEVPQRNRTAGIRHLSKLMTELGWSAVRVRDFNGRGYKEQIRGYCREAQVQHPIPHS